LIGAAAFAVVIPACTSLDRSAEAGRDRVVFASNRSGGLEIYVIDPDGGATVRLTENNGFDGLPHWSPDGSRIVFTSDMDGTPEPEEPGGPSDLELYTMAADGSEVVRLTRNTRYEGDADWSPDGSQLVFDAADPFEDLQVYVMDSEGEEPPKALTSGAPNGHAVWSPDGSRIAFTSLRDGDREIYVMAPDGSGQTNLTNSPGSDDNLAAWSPNGSKIAFFSERDGNPEIYVMDADGSNPVRLTDSPADDVDPSWSPDGRQIVFTSGGEGDSDLYVMAGDGSVIRDLTDNEGIDLMPEWASPGSPSARETPTPGRMEAPGGSVEGVRGELGALIEDVAGATAVRYGAADDLGHEMDTLKVLAAPGGGFVGLYHSYQAGRFDVHLATSVDLMHWTWRVTLAEGASMPTIRPASDGGYVVAWETDPPNHLGFAYYESWEGLLKGVPSRTLDAPRRLSSCAEGTPNLYAASSIRLDVGFHYFGDCELDRQARGTSDWTSWSPARQPALDDALESLGVVGGIGDRDHFTFGGIGFTLIEGMRNDGDWRTWRVFLHDDVTGQAERLDIRTHAGSLAFTIPPPEFATVDGRDATVATLFVPQEGAAGSEAGELIYYRTLGPAGP
jgi:Tol biopolymer transport system component